MVFLLLATGKTHIAKRICRFLSFFHDIPSQIFNVGDYRRQLFGNFLPADFYDPDNEEGLLARHTACDAALADLIAYMRQDGVRVAAFDATNSTKDRRDHVIQMLTDSGLGVKRMFVESICNDELVSVVSGCGVVSCRVVVLCRVVCTLVCRSVLGCHVFLCSNIYVCVFVYHHSVSLPFSPFQILDENIRKVKLSTPDYREMGDDKAIEDFKQRRGTFDFDGWTLTVGSIFTFSSDVMISYFISVLISFCYCCCLLLWLAENYQKVYETVSKDEGPSIKIVDSQQFIVNKIRGYLPLKVVHFCMNLHTLPRTFFISRYVRRRTCVQYGTALSWKRILYIHYMCLGSAFLPRVCVCVFCLFCMDGWQPRTIGVQLGGEDWR